LFESRAWQEAELVEARTSPGMAGMNLAALRGLGRWLALAAALVALSLASIFAGRRFFDFWREGLNGAELVLLTFALAGALTGFRYLWRDERLTSYGPPGDLALHAIPTLAALLLAAAVSSPQSPLWGVIFLWTALATVETWFWSSVAPTLLRSRFHASVAPAVADHVSRPETDETEETLPDEGFPADRLQQLTRFRDEEGADVVQGTVRAELQPGQRVHHLHVAFCPPLSSVPEFACEPVDGPEATLAAGQVETYGARIDIRLSSPAQEGESVVVEFYARAA
jgi:hypothetical protein